MKLEEKIIKAIGGHLGASPEQLTSAASSLEDLGLNATQDEFFQKLGEQVQQWTGSEHKLEDVVTELQFHFQKEVLASHEDDQVLREAAVLLGKVTSHSVLLPGWGDCWAEASESKPRLTVSDVAKAAEELTKIVLSVSRRL